MRKIVGYIGVGLIVAVFIAGFVAYFIYQTDPTTNIMYDGFGRQLSKTPFIMHWIFGQHRLWAGWLWFLGDMIIFWGVLFTGAGLVMWGFNEREGQS